MCGCRLPALELEGMAGGGRGRQGGRGWLEGAAHLGGGGWGDGGVGAVAAGGGALAARRSASVQFQRPTRLEAGSLPAGRPPRPPRPRGPRVAPCGPATRPVPLGPRAIPRVRFRPLASTAPCVVEYVEQLYNSCTVLFGSVLGLSESASTPREEANGWSE